MENQEYFDTKSETLKALVSPTSTLNLYSELVNVLAHPYEPSLDSEISSKVLPQGRFVSRAPRGRSVAKARAAATTEITLEIDGDFFVRPNGSKYFARTWGVHQDVATLRKAREATTVSLTTGGASPMFALLYGAPGTGKTALVEAAFDNVHTVLGTGDTDVAELIGGYVQTPSGSYDWVDGPLLKAAETGEVLFIDEIGLIDPKVLSIVYGAMDGRREIPVTANPSRGSVTIHEDFYVVAATNPNAPGVRLSEALLSRFTMQAEMTTDWALSKKLGVNSFLITAATNLSKKQESGEVSWSPQMRELLAFRDIEKVFGQQFALQNLLAAAPEIDRPQVADILSRAFGEELRPARI
jgi:hypothetical protein